MNISECSFAKTTERHSVDAAIFHNEIVPANRPVILRGLVKDWPTVQQGERSPQAACEYLLQFYRGKPVPLLLGDPAIKRHFFYRDTMDGFNFERRPAPLSDALGALMTHLADEDPPAIYMESMPLPDFLPDFSTVHSIPLVDSTAIPRIWIGNAVKVQTHFDLSKNIACVLAGKRRFTLFPPDQLANLYVGPLDFTLSGPPVSMVTLDNPDFEKFPRFKEALASAEVAELGAGDALYIPYAWWHQVESLANFNILVNYWWNDAVPHTRPFDSLLHAVLAIRDLPDDQRKVWKQMFEYFAFKTSGEPLGHLAPQHRGLLGPLSTQHIAAIKSVLARAFNRS